MSEWFISKVYAGEIIPPIIPTRLTRDALIVNVLNTLLFIAGIIAVVYLIYAGIQYITAGGDATKATAAKTAIVNAIIGIIIITLAFVIPIWVMNAIRTGRM